MTWSPDHLTKFSDPNLAPHLAGVAAIAGVAVCRSLVDVYMDVGITKGAIEPYSHNSLIFQSHNSTFSETFCLSSFDTSVNCHTRRTVFSQDPASTSRVLMPDIDNPDKLRVVTLREPGQEVIKIGTATTDPILTMARRVAVFAQSLEDEPSPWRLAGDNSGDMFKVADKHLVPVVGRLIQTIGTFAAQEAPEGLLVTSRLKADVGSSGRVYGASGHTIQLQTNNTETGATTDFSMRFKFSGRGANGNFSIVRCQLDRRDPNGEVTKDALHQQGRQLVRVRSGSDTQGAGEYPASEQTIFNMAAAAIGVSNTEIG